MLTTADDVHNSVRILTNGLWTHLVPMLELVGDPARIRTISELRYQDLVKDTVLANQIEI